MDDTDKKISFIVKTLVKQSGVKQVDIAEKIGITKAALSQMLSGTAALPFQRFSEIAGIIQMEEADVDRITRLYISKYAIPFPSVNLQKNPSLPKVPDTVQNTSALRECIKDAMMRNGIMTAEDLNRFIDYDNSHTIERLLNGKLNFFPDILSAIFDRLGISHDEAPITPAERGLLVEEGLYNHGAILIRPIPVVEWANAIGHIETLCGGGTVMQKWDPATTETVAAPVGARKDTQAFRVHGQSMEPMIMDNDILFCEPSMSCNDIPTNKIVIAKFIDCGKYPDCVVCKRFRRVGSKILLSSDNRIAGRDFEVDPAEIAWIGVVTSKHAVL